MLRDSFTSDSTGRKTCSYTDFLKLLSQENFDQKVTKEHLKGMVSHVEQKMKNAGYEINWSKSKIEIVKLIRHSAGLKPVQMKQTSMKALKKI